MGQTITFFPEGNAECIFLELDNGKRMLIEVYPMSRTILNFRG